MEATHLLRDSIDDMSPMESSEDCTTQDITLNDGLVLNLGDDLETGGYPKRTNENSRDRRSSLSKPMRTKRKSIARSQLDSTASRHKETSVHEKIGIVAVVVHLFKGNIGPGAMSLPEGFSKTGIYAAPIYFVIVALVSIYNMDLLLYCKQSVSPTRRQSFGDVAGKILGPKGKTLVDVFLVGTQLGICCVYFTFVATNLYVVLPEKLQLVLHERQLILLIYPIILMLSWIRTLRRITPFSTLANVAVILGITIVFYYSFKYSQHPTKQQYRRNYMDISQFPSFYGTAVYSFEGIGLILPIQNEMQDPYLFPRVLHTCMILILILFLFIGAVPTLAFGRITNGSMTAVLHEYCEGWLVTMANLFLAFACLLSFPIQFYPAVEVLEKSLNRRSVLMRPETNIDSSIVMVGVDQDNMNEQRHRRRSSIILQSNRRGQLRSLPLPPSIPPSPTFPQWMESLCCSISQYELNRTIFRSMLCTSLMIIAVCIPDVGLLISLFGAIGSSMLAIIIPPILYLRLPRSQSLSILSITTHFGLILIGIIGMMAGTYQAVNEIVSSWVHK